MGKNFTDFLIYIQNANIKNVLSQYMGSVIIFASGSTAITIEDVRNTISYLNSTRKDTFKKFITIINMKWFEL
jgi:hypothetical protein